MAAAFIFIVSGYAQGHQVIFKEINQLKASGAIPAEAQILKFLSMDVQQREYDLKGLNKGTIVSLSKEGIENLLLNRNDFIHVRIPLDNQSEMTLILKRNEIFTNDFALYSSSDPRTPVTYTPGVHYKGIVEGEPTSIVALSVFSDQVMGMIGIEHGNFVIMRINNDPENRHIIYNNNDLVAPFEFECGTPDDGLEYTKEMLENKLTSRDVSDCVRLYIEINNDIVADKGGVGPAIDFVTGLYNQSFTIFSNESINMMINEILVWTSQSPYHSGSAQQKLAAFKTNTSFFNGDLCQLLGYSNDGVAGPNGICHVDPDFSKCYSGIHPFASNQSIIFICHELGHLLGSAHTHACVWNGNNTAIDGCAAVEGNCPQPPPAPDWTGTLMSYCFPAFDPYDGFGPQPGNVIRNTVNAADNCLTACGPPTSYCLSYGLTSNNKYIKKVVLGSINNLTGNDNGYGNYLSKSTNLTAGNAYFISLTPGSNGSTKYWRVFIDYNGDNDWDDAGEMVGQNAGSQVVNINFTVPLGASSIATRMRTSMSYNNYVSGCGTFPYGEVEDYTVVIQIPCPDADGDSVCDADDVCPGFDDILIGMGCDDGDECTENDVYLGAPDCNCAGTLIEGCVPCDPQATSLTPNPLTHTGTGATSTNVLTLPSGSSDTEFTISGLNAKLGGNANGRFIDRVNVWYDGGSGTQQYGTFNGNQQSTADVFIAGPIQSVWVTLEDGYDGNSAVTQSISFSPVTHCTAPQPFIQGDGENTSISLRTRSVGSALQVYPNPVRNKLTIILPENQMPGHIRIYDCMGKEIYNQLSPDTQAEIDVSHLPAGMYYIRTSAVPVAFLKN